MGRNHFTLIVAGEKPFEMVKKYDKTKDVEPYVVLEAKKASEYHKEYIKYYEALLKMDLPENEKELYQSVLSNYNEMDDMDFYLDISDSYEMDPETGNALSRVNPNGRYDSCRIGKELSMPLINKDGEETFSCKKGDIEWDKIHLANQDVYKSAWEMVMEGKEPATEEEKNVYNNMKNRQAYFEQFDDKDNYVISSTAFWGYAFLSEAQEWIELEDNKSQFEWCKNFFDRFIKPLNDDTLITVFECTRF